MGHNNSNYRSTCIFQSMILKKILIQKLIDFITTIDYYMLYTIKFFFPIFLSHNFLTHSYLVSDIAKQKRKTKKKKKNLNKLQNTHTQTNIVETWKRIVLQWIKIKHAKRHKYILQYTIIIVSWTESYYQYSQFSKYPLLQQKWHQTKSRICLLNILVTKLPTVFCKSIWIPLNKVSIFFFWQQ